MDSVTDICKLSYPVLRDQNTGQGHLRSQGKKGETKKIVI